MGLNIGYSQIQFDRGRRFEGWLHDCGLGYDNLIFREKKEVTWGNTKIGEGLNPDY